MYISVRLCVTCILFYVYCVRCVCDVYTVVEFVCDVYTDDVCIFA